MDDRTETKSKVIYNSGARRSINKIVLSMTGQSANDMLCVDSIIALDAHYLNSSITAFKLSAIFNDDPSTTDVVYA